MSANDNWMNITSDPIILEFYISFLFSLLNRSQGLKCAIYCYKQILKWLHIAWKINKDFAVISNLLLKFSYLCYWTDTSWIFLTRTNRNIFIVLKTSNELTYCEKVGVFISVSLLDWISLASYQKIANNECKHFTFKALVLFDLCFLFI